MTTEEHFARIDERLDATAMHLELTARMVVDNERRAEERNRQAEEHNRKAEEHNRQAEEHNRQTDRQIDKILCILAETGKTMTRLANIAEAHEQRIEDLESHQ